MMLDSEDLNYLEELENFYNMKKKYNYYYVELKEGKIYLKCITENKEKFFSEIIMEYIEYTKKTNSVVKFYDLVAPGNMQLLCKIDKGQLFTY